MTGISCATGEGDDIVADVVAKNAALDADVGNGIRNLERRNVADTGTNGSESSAEQVSHGYN